MKSKRELQLVTLAFLFIGLLKLNIGCLPSPIDREPTRSELVGTWKLSAPMDDPDLVSELKLYSNGSATVSNLPIADHWPYTTKLVSSECRWELEFNRPTWDVRLYVLNNGSGKQIAVMVKNGEIVLEYIFDPDQPGKYIYRKEK